MRTALAILLFCACAMCAGATEETSVHAVEPRAFGHFVGDVLTRSFEIDAQDGETFVAASLPQPGQLAYWLELRQVATGSVKRAGASRQILSLIYQLFYVPVDTRKLKIPAMNIELSGPAGKRVATLPPFTFLVSPIREIYPEKSGETTETFLRADTAAERANTGPMRTALLASSVASLAALLGLAHHRAWWPFHGRAGRPFSEARRKISDALRQETYAGYAQGLTALHRAFDEANGRRLLARDIDSFFARHSEQADMRQEADRFFEASRAYFYAADPDAATALLPGPQLENLAARLADNERGAA